MRKAGRETIRLTPAQESAVECRDWSEEPLMRAAWSGPRIEFATADREALFYELCEASNAEDAFAEMPEHGPACRAFARRAAKSLGILAGKALGV